MANLTADDIVNQALGRVGEVTSTYPSARGPMWRRVGYRQRQLFAIAAKINPERFGTCAFSDLSGNPGDRLCDLNDIASPVPTPELIQAITIKDKGTSPYNNGDHITLVTIEDMDAELAPRALLRDRILIGVGSDLDLVTSITIHFSKLPDLFTHLDRTKEIELEAPWDTLLEIDLAKWVLTKASQLSAETRGAAIESLTAEEGPLLADFKAHVAEYSPTVSRFVPPRVAMRAVTEN